MRNVLDFNNFIPFSLKCNSVDLSDLETLRDSILIEKHRPLQANQMSAVKFYPVNGNYYLELRNSNLEISGLLMRICISKRSEKAESSVVNEKTVDILIDLKKDKIFVGTKSLSIAKKCFSLLRQVLDLDSDSFKPLNEGYVLDESDQELLLDEIYHSTGVATLEYLNEFVEFH